MSAICTDDPFGESAGGEDDWAGFESAPIPSEPILPVTQVPNESLVAPTPLDFGNNDDDWTGFESVSATNDTISIETPFVAQTIGNNVAENKTIESNIEVNCDFVSLESTMSVAPSAVIGQDTATNVADIEDWTGFETTPVTTSIVETTYPETGVSMTSTEFAVEVDDNWTGFESSSAEADLILAINEAPKRSCVGEDSNSEPLNVVQEIVWDSTTLLATETSAENHEMALTQVIEDGDLLASTQSFPKVIVADTPEAHETVSLEPIDSTIVHPAVVETNEKTPGGDVIIAVDQEFTVNATHPSIDAIPAIDLVGLNADVPAVETVFVHATMSKLEVEEEKDIWADCAPMSVEEIPTVISSVDLSITVDITATNIVTGETSEKTEINTYVQIQPTITLGETAPSRQELNQVFTVNADIVSARDLAESGVKSDHKEDKDIFFTEVADETKVPVETRLTKEVSVATTVAKDTPIVDNVASTEDKTIEVAYEVEEELAPVLLETTTVETTPTVVVADVRPALELESVETVIAPDTNYEQTGLVASAANNENLVAADTEFTSEPAAEVVAEEQVTASNQQQESEKERESYEAAEVVRNKSDATTGTIVADHADQPRAEVKAFLTLPEPESLEVRQEEASISEPSSAPEADLLAPSEASDHRFETIVNTDIATVVLESAATESAAELTNETTDFQTSFEESSTKDQGAEEAEEDDWAGFEAAPSFVDLSIAIANSVSTLDKEENLSSTTEPTVEEDVSFAANTTGDVDVDSNGKDDFAVQSSEIQAGNDEDEDDDWAGFEAAPTVFAVSAADVTTVPSDISRSEKDTKQDEDEEEDDWAGFEAAPSVTATATAAAATTTTTVASAESEPFTSTTQPTAINTAEALMTMTMAPTVVLSEKELSASQRSVFNLLTAAHTNSSAKTVLLSSLSDWQRFSQLLAGPATHMSGEQQQENSVSVTMTVTVSEEDMPVIILPVTMHQPSSSSSSLATTNISQTMVKSNSYSRRILSEQVGDALPAKDLEAQLERLRLLPHLLSQTQSLHLPSTSGSSAVAVSGGTVTSSASFHFASNNASVSFVTDPNAVTTASTFSSSSSSAATSDSLAAVAERKLLRCSSGWQRKIQRLSALSVSRSQDTQDTFAVNSRSLLNKQTSLTLSQSQNQSQSQTSVSASVSEQQLWQPTDTNTNTNTNGTTNIIAKDTAKNGNKEEDIGDDNGDDWGGFVDAPVSAASVPVLTPAVSANTSSSNTNTTTMGWSANMKQLYASLPDLSFVLTS